LAERPTTGHTQAFRPGTVRTEPDGRMYSAVFEKNAKPVIDGLSAFLAGRTGTALEIGSGTGQHIIAFYQAFPALTWTPSEPDLIHRASIDAWRAHSNAPTSRSISLDAARDWANSPEILAITPLTLILSLNVIHISPIGVLHGILNGAGKTLGPDGFLGFYGPFTENGAHTGDGNAMFDRRLRADNPDWGVRDVDDLRETGAGAGLVFHALLPMPSNNRLLILTKP
jgi:hypothetical protein